MHTFLVDVEKQSFSMRILRGVNVFLVIAVSSTKLNGILVTIRMKEPISIDVLILATVGD